MRSENTARIFEHLQPIATNLLGAYPGVGWLVLGLGCSSMLIAALPHCDLSLTLLPSEPLPVQVPLYPQPASAFGAGVDPSLALDHPSTPRSRQSIRRVPAPSRRMVSAETWGRWPVSIFLCEQSVDTQHPFTYTPSEARGKR